MMKMTKKFYLLSVVVILIIASFPIYKSLHLSKKKFEAITYKKNSGWGYAILKDGKTFIQQDFIPVIQQEIPFKNESEARRISLLVLEKVESKKNPTVTLDDLLSLKINY